MTEHRGGWDFGNCPDATVYRCSCGYQTRSLSEAAAHERAHTAARLLDDDPRWIRNRPDDVDAPQSPAEQLLTYARLDARQAYACFDQMSTAELRRLQLAHALDHEQARTPEAIAFGGGRLALIAAVLRSRGLDA
ncbi:MAG TPA: hypothetical protein VGP77_10925 [Vicinamibacterales bacterium]|nr:hypothetical protein [Vicinamibacterales bacterium]